MADDTKSPVHTMRISPRTEPRSPRSSSSSRTRDWNLSGGVEDPDGVIASVAQCIELLRATSASPQDKELVSKQLYSLAKSREDARLAVSSHAQAIPLLVALLRSGTLGAKINAAATLGVLCKEEDLRVKVLLGGCIPPLLTLLKLGAGEAQTAAAEAIHAVTKGGIRDHVGSRIFSTEGVVSSLWEQLQSSRKSTICGLLTGALRNLCNNNTDSFTSATLHAKGVDVLVDLLETGDSVTQANACSLLASLMMVSEVCRSRALAAGVVSPLLKLLSTGNEISVRAEAAGALRSLSRDYIEASQAIASHGGISKLVAATVAPSKEFMQGEFAQSLQDNAIGALANISGGMSAVISSLAKALEASKSDSQAADTIGALAYALMVIDEQSKSAEAVSPGAIEGILVKQLCDERSDFVQERVIEAMASLYGNAFLRLGLEHAEAKRMLVGLVTMAYPEVKEELLKSLLSLSGGKENLWRSLRGREGVQLLITLLGLSSEQQQEYAVALLSIMCEEIEESKWAITAAGGIPPLVQLLETGSSKAKEDAAAVLGSLCSHSEEIRACVETADAVPALLWLLKNAGLKGQEIAANALSLLVSDSDASTMSQLTAMLTGDLPESKIYVLDVVGCLLSVASEHDILRNEAAANEALQTVIRLLSSTKEETQGRAASVLAGVLSLRKDMRESQAVAESVGALIHLVKDGREPIAAQAAKALGALFRSVDTNYWITSAAKHATLPLISLAKSQDVEVTEVAVSALANLLQKSEVAVEVPAEDIISPLSRVLCEGSRDGKENAARALVHLLSSFPVDDALAERLHACGTVLALSGHLADTNFEKAASSQALEALALLARAKRGGNFRRPPWTVLADVPDGIAPLITCLAAGAPELSEKAIKVLSRLCRDQSEHLGDMISVSPQCINALAERIISSSSLEVRTAGSSLLICTMKKHRQRSVEALDAFGSLFRLIRSLVDMLGGGKLHEDSSVDVGRKQVEDEEADNDPASTLGATVALWLLSLIASHDSKQRLAIMEAGTIDVLTEKLANFAPNAQQADVEDNGSTWTSALLLAILFQDRDVTRSPATMRAIPPLAILLRSEEAIDRYFAAQALCGLVCNGSRGTVLAVANSGAVVGLIPLLGHAEADMPNMVKLAEEFSLLSNPDQVALDKLFRVDDIRFGATARKAIPALVDLLKPLADRPGAPPLALALLTELANGNNSNKLVMAEAGALEALTKYLSLGPQDSYEEAAAELLRILFGCPELRRHESAPGAVEQLVAVLRMGTRTARFTAARALEGLFSSDNVKAVDTAGQAIQPLLEMLQVGGEREQQAAVGALIKISSESAHKAMAIADAEPSALESLCRILTSDCSLGLKEDIAELCRVLFASSRVRATAAATSCVEPLVALLRSQSSTAQYAGARALDNLLDDEQQGETVAAYGAVVPLVGMMAGAEASAQEAAVSCLIKLGKDRPLCKLDMVKAGVIENVLENFSEAPDSLCAVNSELLRILTNNSSIAKGSAASKAVEPLFLALSRPDLSTSGQHSALQVLVNILEKPQRVANLSLTPSQTIEPLIVLLNSTSQPVQQLSAELLSLLLAEDNFQKDAMTQLSVLPLVRLVGVGVQSLQQKALKALESASNSWPNAVVEAGGISEISKVILQVDPQPPHALWESAALVLSNVLRFSSQYFLQVPVAVLVKMLRSVQEATVVVSLNALLVLERDDASSAEIMAESGAIEALLELLRCHQCEEAAARLLEALFINVKVRDMKVCKLAISPLSQYLLDPQTRLQPAKLLAALALGDIFQHEGLARTTDAASACRALVSLLEDQPTEEMKMVAVCALQNLVANSRSNKRAVAEAGGIQVVLELLSSNNAETAAQAAALLRLLFSNHTIQEYASSEIIQILAGTIEKDLWSGGSVSEDALKAMDVLFLNFPRLRGTEEATLCIPQLAGALRAPSSEAAQEAALDCLFLLRQAWPSSPAEVGKAQSTAMAEAIPVLQLIMRSGPERLHERVDSLLQCLPGSLVVTIKRGINLKQSMGNTNAFCKLTLGNGAPRMTKVVSHSTSPEWKQGFAWAFDTPPKGQKLHISCKSKNAFGKGKLGKVTIQIDRVVMLGTISGEYQLKPDINRDGSFRMLEIEFQWSNNSFFPPKPG